MWRKVHLFAKEEFANVLKGKKNIRCCFWCFFYNIHLSIISLISLIIIKKYWYSWQRSAIPVCRRSIPIPIPPEGQGQYPIPIPILQSAWGQYPIPIPILVLPKGQYQYQYQYCPKVLYLDIITNTVLLKLLDGKESNRIEFQKWYCYFHSV